jgi:UDP-N-acetylmuramate--alanine ligase
VRESTGTDLRDLQSSPIRRAHFIGLGGVGMSGLALLLQQLGWHITGCDIQETRHLLDVQAHGIPVVVGHSASHLAEFDATCVVRTSAVSDSHPEIVEARRLGLPVLHRSDLLSVLFNDSYGLGVAGSHGKTTTSSMLSWILQSMGYEPCIAVGGEVRNIGTNASIGAGYAMVAELDESDGSFAAFRPAITVVTNVDLDHVDHYPSQEAVEKAFADFLAHRRGLAILCGDDPGIRSLLEKGQLAHPYILYGFSADCDAVLSDYRPYGGGSVCRLKVRDGETLLRLRIPGRHNVLNAAGAVLAAYSTGLGLSVASVPLEEFVGAERRFQRIGEAGDVLFLDDYGHHPREVEATLQAARESFPDRRIVAVFQPHRYTRTAAFGQQFGQALGLADRVLLLPVYGASEPPIPGVSQENIRKAMPDRFPVDCLEEPYIDGVAKRLRKGDVVLFIGAGNIAALSRQVLSAMQACGGREENGFSDSTGMD